MLSAIGSFFRRRYIGLQVGAVLIWLGLEIFGLGFGLIGWLTRQSLTDAGPPGLGALISRPPPGPMRLDPAERAAVATRLTAAFGADVPKHDELAGMVSFYELEAGSNCRWRRSADIAFDRRECNRLKFAKPFFAELLRAMHGERQHLFWRELPAKGGGHIQVAFFPGHDRPRILIDLGKVRSEHWQTGEGFTAIVAHGGGVGATAFDLGREAQSGVFLSDDPGAFERGRMCPPPGCPVRIVIKARPADDTHDSMGRPVWKVRPASASSSKAKHLMPGPPHNGTRKTRGPELSGSSRATLRKRSRCYRGCRARPPSTARAREATAWID